MTTRNLTRRSLILSWVTLPACRHSRRVEYDPTTEQSSPSGDADSDYRFGVEPMRPTGELWSRYSPLIRILNRRISDFRVHLESSLVFADYLAKVRRGDFDFGVFEPNFVLEAEQHGYAVFARVGARDRIAGVVVVRADSGIRTLRDLRGKTICFGPPNALASTMLVRLWLREAGLRRRDAVVVFTSSQESALLDVLAGNAAAAGSSYTGWRQFQSSHPEQAAELELKWRTADLPGPALMAHRRVPQPHVTAIRTALLDIPADPEGQRALEKIGFSEFRPAESGTYDDVWEFLNTYTRTFGAGATR